MKLFELVFSVILLLLVVGVATAIALRQRRTVQDLRRNSDLSTDERHFVRFQVIRRLLGAGLLGLFGALLIGWFFLAPEMDALAPPAGQDIPEHVKDSIRLYTTYWIVALLLLLALLAVAVVDLWATARFGIRHQRQLERDRKALFEEEAARLRQRRAEMN